MDNILRKRYIVFLNCHQTCPFHVTKLSQHFIPHLNHHFFLSWKKFHFNQTAVFQLLLSVLGYLHSSSHLKEWQPTRTFVRESPKLATKATSKVLRYQKGRKQLTANSATSTGANFRTDIIIELFHLLTKCLGRKKCKSWFWVSVRVEFIGNLGL